ncbi:hypothetical protein [Devosia sp. 1566]|uniref:hypothetical protein n=1 Tax=Devosia sp. 1566 TaxID=2499144 RepID=UPI000FD6CE4D|nr:hypothetical protein [Devosia sp. 1566]
MHKTSLPAALLTATFLALAGPVAAQSGLGWTRFEDPALGYRIEVPLDHYGQDGAADASGIRTFDALDGSGQLSIFGAPNTDDLSIAQLQEAVASSGQIDNVTYRASGNSWFVLSGYDTDENGRELVVYTKFLFNRDRSAFAAFEISYPEDERSRYNPIVTRIEKSLRAPAPV